MNQDSIEAMAQAIITAHHARLGLPVSESAAIVFHHGDPVCRAAKQAAHALAEHFGA